MHTFSRMKTTDFVCDKVKSEGKADETDSRGLTLSSHIANNYLNYLKEVNQL